VSFYLSVISEREYVYCAVGTESLNTVQVYFFSLKAMSWLRWLVASSYRG
jgi:hypothetical protein